jgi:hypothetical protein
MKELTDAVEKMNPAQIKDLEQRVQTNKESGFWKKALAYGLTLFTLGMYSPTVNADEATTVIDNQRNTTMSTPQGNIGHMNGQQVILPEGNIGIKQDGGLVVRYTDNIPQRQKPGYNKYPSQTKSQSSYEIFKAETEDMLRSNASPQQLRA